MIRKISPTRVVIEGHDDKLALIRQYLTYHNKTIDFEISRFKKNPWFVNRYGMEAYQDHLAELKTKRLVCLLDESDGVLSTYSGVADFIAHKLNTDVIDEVVYPAPKTIPWVKVPGYELFPYQEQAIELLLEKKHGAVSLATGSGKSAIALHLVKRLGLPALVMTPYTNISEQLYADFLEFLGKSKVGRFYGSHKESTKLVTVANGASLTRLEPDSEHYRNFQKSQVFIADESHSTPCTTFEKVCSGLAANAPYRFFLSATQMRNDGSDLLLKGITGEVLLEKDVLPLVDEGYLARPVFHMVRTYSIDTFRRDDAMEMTRRHLYYNSKVLAIVADITNKSVSLLGHSVLILVEEIDQFVKLLPLLKHPVQFAHGGTNVSGLPTIYQKCRPSDLVKRFNSKEFPILVGTSCVSTGTNFKIPKTVIYFQGGKSEIQVRQAIGRSTRLFEDKKSCNIWDFDVANIETTHRHALVRKSIYEGIYPPVKEISYGQ